MAVTLEPPSSRTWCCVPPNRKPHGPSPEQVKLLLVVQHHVHAHRDSLPKFSVFGSPAEEFLCPDFSPLDPPQPTKHDTKLCPLGSALFAGLSCSPPSPGAELKVQHTHLTDGRTKAVIFPQNRFEKQGRARI